MKISIAMATYNGAKNIREQLESIAWQTEPPFEIVVIDDQSSDATVSIVEALALELSLPIRVYQNEQRLGYAQNFYKAMSRCRGDVIALCDQDDVWMPEKCSRLRKKFSESNAQVVSHDFTIFFDDDRDEIPSYYSYLERQGYPRCVNIKGCTTAITSEIFKKAGSPDPHSKIPHDYLICLIGSITHNRHYLPEQLIRHRIHAGNTSGYIASSPSQPIALLKSSLLKPRNTAEELDYLLWIGANSEIIGDIGHMAGNLVDQVTEDAQRAVARQAKILERVPGATKRGSIGRATRVFGDVLRGRYIGRGWPMGLAKDILGSRNKVTKTNS